MYFLKIALSATIALFLASNVVQAGDVKKAKKSLKDARHVIWLIKKSIRQAHIWSICLAAKLAR